MNRFYFTGFLGTATKQLLNDIKEYENVSILDEIVLPFSSKLAEKIYYWWYLKLVPRREISCGNLFNKKYPIYNMDFSQEDTHYIVFGNSALVKAYNKAFFRRLKKKNPNIKLVLYIVDPMNGYGCRRIPYVENEFDLIISHVKEDCEQYGYQYFTLMYSKIECEESDKKSDMYFCGGNGVGFDEKDGIRHYHRGGRISELHSIYAKGINNGLKMNFYVTGVNDLDMDNETDITYNHPISNEENIENVCQSNCILEVMHEGFQAITTRYLEAVCYNRKILTNNKNIVNMKYYNPNYMKVFNSIEDIDWAWAKLDEKVDYGYENDFSPIRFIKELPHMF